MLDKDRLSRDEYTMPELASFLVSKGNIHLDKKPAEYIELFASIVLEQKIFKAYPPRYFIGDQVIGVDGNHYMVYGITIDDISPIIDNKTPVWIYFCQREISGGYYLEVYKDSNIREKIGHKDPFDNFYP